MGRKHVVRRGECVASIARDHGLEADAVWNDAGNDDLKRRRGNPYVLLEGDVLELPDRPAPSLSLQPGQSNRFKARPPTLKLRVTLADGDGTRTNTAFVFEAHGRTQRGTSDGDGVAELSVAPGDRRGLLTVGEGDTATVLRLDLGYLDPADQLAGVKQRLQNLGFHAGVANDKPGPELSDALRRFQSAHGLDATGTLDDDTRQKLRDVHGD